MALHLTRCDHNKFMLPSHNVHTVRPVRTVCTLWEVRYKKMTYADGKNAIAVSYTHLTLPTKRIV